MSVKPVWWDGGDLLCLAAPERSFWTSSGDFPSRVGRGSLKATVAFSSVFAGASADLSVDEEASAAGAAAPAAVVDISTSDFWSSFLMSDIMVDRLRVKID